jgi:hypothetical protein
MLDLLADAYDRALDALPPYGAHDPETARAVLLTGILDAARAGVHDEMALTIAALHKLAVFDAANNLEATRSNRAPMPL